MKSYKYFVFLLCVFIFSCSNQQKDNKKIFRINLEEEPLTLHPCKARLINSAGIIHMLNDGLTRYNLSNEIELALAKNIVFSEDGQSLTIHLREAKWTDGSLVTAQDFLRSFYLSLHPDYASPLCFLLYPIKNAKQIKSKEKPLEELGIRIVDEKTFVIELCQQTPYILDLFAHPIFFPIAKKEDLTNGPFCLVKWMPQSQMILEKNQTYWE